MIYLMYILVFLVVKSLNLSRTEAVDVLSGVWPGFRELSEEKSLLNFAPTWFKRVYAPPVAKPVVLCLDDGCDSSASIPVSPISRNRQVPSLGPLLLWLAENRIRWAVSETVPKIGRVCIKTIIPIFAILFLLKNLPRNQKNASIVFLLCVYVWSITRGLPGFTEKWFKTFGFHMYRKKGERKFQTNQYNGNIQAVLFALIEPLVPIINTTRRRLSLKAMPDSPMSQASTLDATQHLDHLHLIASSGPTQD